MKRRDVVSSLFCLIFGTGICVFSIIYGVGRLSAPGPGLVPLIAGILLVFLSLFHGWLTIKKDGASESRPEAFFPEKDSIRKTSFSILGLFAYGFLMESLGFVLTTGLFLAFMLAVVQGQRLKMTIMATVMATGFSYLLFVYLLQAQLPIGVFGF